MKNCIVIIGRVGSGKTTTAKILAKWLSYKFIEVSDVVKVITKRERDTIRLNKLVGRVVAKELIKKMIINHNYVVSGIRQKEILEELKKWYTLYIVKLNLPQRLRYKRVSIREHMSFKQLQEADKLDNNLGLKEVIKLKGFVIKKDNTLDKNVSLILEHLSKRGVKA